MPATLITSITDWYCPNCGATDMTKEARPHSRFHVCPKLHMMTTPMVRVGTKARVDAKEREDYANGDKLQLFDGRPVMSIVTTRDDGQDAMVFAPTAVAAARNT